MFSKYKKTDRKGGEKKQKGKAHMYTYRRSVFSKRTAEAKPYAAVGAWFLGPKAENGKIFTDLATKSFNAHLQFRKSYFPCDPPYVTEEVKEALSFKRANRKMEEELDKIQQDMCKSVPFFSTRYKGHVIWDTNLPANLGYIASILWHQNNCIQEASPVTTMYELEAGSDLCEMLGLDRNESMGHLVTGGSVANIEAMWVARNLKFYPLGLQEALIKEEKLKGAREYEIYLPQGKDVRLVEATTWELLNLDTDTILKMPSDVSEKAGITQDELGILLTKHLYECIGVTEFNWRHKLTQNPCVVAASTYHVSFDKAMTILGIGRENLVHVPVDEDARINIERLREILNEKWKNRIPVISVISIIGTTEESAVDPLEKILIIRDELKKKEEGLNFSIHADAAWGAYFASMLRDPPRGQSKQNVEDEAFVPELSLSEYVIKQMEKIKECDTITGDPHKSGFCPYPAGAICYRKKELNKFVNFTGETVYYHGKHNLGDLGIEGSKPGSAASAVYMANKVIGLHKDGYGRLLAECMFTAKVLYCYLLCMAEDDDDFVVEMTKPLPAGVTKDYIRNNIIGKTNEQLANDDELMRILRTVGPDTLIPCFAVNIRDNKDVKIANKVNQAVFNDLSHISAEETSQRIPLIVTLSTMEAHKHPLEAFKKRLGLDPQNKGGVKYIITTCLDPWSTSLDFVDDMAAILRNATLNAIGTVQDQADNHSFVSGDRVNGNKEIFVCYVGNFNQLQRQYFTVARFRFTSDEDVRTFEDKSSTTSKPIVLRSSHKKILHNVLYNDTGSLEEEFDFYEGLPTESSKPFMRNRMMKVVDVPRYDHFDKADDQYPKSATYILYGDVGHAYLFHSPTKDPDYLQIVRLAEAPSGLGESHEKDMILKQGVNAELLDVRGSPKFDPDGKRIVDPLQNSTKQYEINFIGIDGKEVKTPVVIERKIWFDGEVLNKSVVS